MAYPRLIPCLDVAGGRVVKCVRFENQRDVGDPVEMAARYSSAGADELVFLDIEATTAGRVTTLEMVRRVADRVSIPFTVGGGLRTLDDALACVEAGADRVSLNSAALADPRLITAVAGRFGAQAVVVAIDARGGMVHSHAGTRPTTRRAVDWAREAADAGAGEILLTSIDADGTRTGYDLSLTAEVVAAVGIPVIASGGAGSAQHVAEVLGIAPAALVASIVHDDPASLAQVRDQVIACGITLRPLADALANV
ncbi:MAG: imidazole glycerol phosphate synthase cyclase subunit [Candidatus Dormibacteraeota bacterium]|nr:imidazole glycerol phosphate synthase cyclase subunit [Candidatus Dormibacteraeota bacterium]